MERDQEIFEDGLQKLYDKMKADPLFKEKVEFGKFLVRHIDSLTPDERKRYDELQSILLNSEQNVQASVATGDDSSKDDGNKTKPI